MLAQELQACGGQDAVVLGIPRGGLVVAGEIARALNADLDVVFTRKLRAPGNPELAIGAVAEDGRVVLDEVAASSVGAMSDYIESEKTRVQAEIARRVSMYRKIRPKVPLAGRFVIVTDDGVATGATMQAALRAARQEGPQKLIAALPVGPEDTLRKLAEYSDETICLRSPSFFDAIGRFYTEFEQIEDEALLGLLQEKAER